jgi:hypothetical protein
MTGRSVDVTIDHRQSRAAAAGGTWRKAGDESINEPVIVLKERNDGA